MVLWRLRLLTLDSTMVILAGSMLLQLFWAYRACQQYYGLPSTAYTSSAITPVGDLYRHGEWVPVIAGMFLLGCLVRLLDESLDVRVNPHAMFLVLLFFPTLVKSEDDWISMVAGIPAATLFWLVAVSLSFRRRST
jgi:threonine/homoserine/homoserine lactone efflux protein